MREKIENKIKKNKNKNRQPEDADDGHCAPVENERDVALCLSYAPPLQTHENVRTLMKTSVCVRGGGGGGVLCQVAGYT